jgi:hypothetical protein
LTINYYGVNIIIFLPQSFYNCKKPAKERISESDGHIGGRWGVRNINLSGKIFKQLVEGAKNEKAKEEKHSSVGFSEEQWK